MFDCFDFLLFLLVCQFKLKKNNTIIVLILMEFVWLLVYVMIIFSYTFLNKSVNVVILSFMVLLVSSVEITLGSLYCILKKKI